MIFLESQSRFRHEGRPLLSPVNIYRFHIVYSYKCKLRVYFIACVGAIPIYLDAVLYLFLYILVFFSVCIVQHYINSSTDIIFKNKY